MAFLVTAILLLPSISHAQATLKIAAVVNDEIISVFDLSQRVNLVITFSNLPFNRQVQQRIAPDVLRRLVLEQLHLQEAERLGIEIPDERIDAIIADMERARSLPPRGMIGFLDSRGVDIEALRQQLRAREAWIATVARLFRGLVTISDVEVEDIFQRNQARAGQQEYLLAEIFLDYSTGSRPEVAANAQQIMQQLQRGASFEQLAQNFSESTSAARGGMLGWVTAEDVDDAVGSTLANMAENTVSSPISTQDGLYIVSVRDKRIARGIGEAAPDPTIGLQQLHIAIPAGTPPSSVDQAVARLNILRQQVATCEALTDISQTEGSPLSGFLGNFKASQLNDQFRQSIKDLPENGVSAPIRTADGVIVLMVCSRTGDDTSDAVEQAKQNIRTQLLNERLAQLAEQHEAKMRREAFIEIRL